MHKSFAAPLISITLAISATCAAAQEQWEVPHPFRVPDAQLVTLFGAEGATFPDEARRMAAYAHYAMSCFQMISLKLFVSKELVQANLEMKQVIEDIREKSLFQFSKHKEEYDALPEKIREAEADVAHLTELSNSFRPHIAFGVDALSAKFPHLASDDVANRNYSAVVKNFMGYREGVVSCAGHLDTPAPQNAPIPFAAGWNG